MVFVAAKHTAAHGADKALATFFEEASFYRGSEDLLRGLYEKREIGGGMPGSACAFSNSGNKLIIGNCMCAIRWENRKI